MEEKRKALEERIKSFSGETQFFRDILAPDFVIVSPKNLRQRV